MNVQFPWGKTVQGREAMRTAFHRIFQAFPDIHVKTENFLEDGPWVVIEWLFKGTMRGEFAGHPPTGRQFILQGCEVFQVTKGKIRRQHGYWDKASMFGQLGITA